MQKHSLSTFYAIVLTQALSLIGSRMTSIAVGIWVFAQTGLTAPLLLTAFFAELPGMLGGSLAGVLVDRWPRKTLLILVDCGQAVGTLLLLLSFASGRFQLWHLYSIAFLQGSFAILQGPAWQSTITMLVPEPQRERANGIQEIGFPLASVIAPVLAGLVYAWLGVAWVIALDLLSFSVAVVMVALSTIPEPAPDLLTGPALTRQASLRRAVGELLAGLHYVVARRGLLLLLLYMALTHFLLNGPLDLTIPYLLQITASEAALGWLMGVMSLGALSGALLVAAWGGTRPRIFTILGGMFLNGVMFLVYGTTRHPLLLGLGLFLIMLPLPVGNALFNAIVQVKVPPGMQGRVFGLFSQLGYLGSTLSFLLTGQLVDKILEPTVGGSWWGMVAPLVGSEPGSGMGLVLIVTGAIMLAATLAAAWIPAVRQLESRLPDVSPPFTAPDTTFD